MHKLTFCFTEAGRNNNQDKNEHTCKQKTYEQKGEAEHVRANQDHIYKIEIDNLWQRISGEIDNS